MSLKEYFQQAHKLACTQIEVSRRGKELSNGTDIAHVQLVQQHMQSKYLSCLFTVQSSPILPASHFLEVPNLFRLLIDASLCMFIYHQQGAV